MVSVVVRNVLLLLEDEDDEPSFLLDNDVDDRTLTGGFGLNATTLLTKKASRANAAGDFIVVIMVRPRLLDGVL